MAEVTRNGRLLAKGYAEWTENEDSLETILLDAAGGSGNPAPRIGGPQHGVLVVRNGSDTVDVTVYYGHYYSIFAGDTKASLVSCTMNATANTITSTAHGLKIGDLIIFATTAGGVTAGVEYYVIAASDADTFQFATARGGTAFNVTADIGNSWSIQNDFAIRGNFTVEKWQAATTTVPATGCEEIYIEGAFKPMFVKIAKSAATAPAFTVYAELRGVA